MARHHSLIPSLFHRRMLLILGFSGCAFGALAVRLGILSLSKGGEFRAQTEASLMREQWVPGARGKILDRKGRVLAQDRPSYDISVSYDVVEGEAWYRQKAARWARRLSGHRWFDLSPQERQEREAALVPVFQGHLDRAWDELARRAKVSRAELDARRDEIITSVARKQEMIAAWREARAKAQLTDAGKTPTSEQEKEMERLANRPIAERDEDHVVLARVSDEVGFSCMMLEQEEVELSLPAFDAGTDEAQTRTISVELFPGLEVVDVGQREYPLERMEVEVDTSSFPGPLRADGTKSVVVDGVACHILGRVRDSVQAGDAEARKKFLSANPAYADRALIDTGGEERVDRGAYRARDRVGAAGIEYAQEQWLRPLRGVHTRRVDSGATSQVAPENGKDLHLTLDIQLQARVQAAMDPRMGLAKVQAWQGHHEDATQREGDALYGAAVVLDIDTGETLAMVSTPTFTREDLAEHPERIYGNDVETLVSTPGINKAIAKAYVPGSIVKACLLTEAISRGVIDVGRRIACNGYLWPDQPNKARCWIFKQTQETSRLTHNIQLGHDLEGSEALMVSCNVFFFTLGRMMGVPGIVSAYQDFGVGTRYELGVGYEHAGSLGRATGAGTGVKRAGEDSLGLNIFDAIQMGIGQGPITWTPMHAADAYATLARSGVRVAPRLIRNGPKGPEARDLGFSTSAIEEAMRGLKMSVNEAHGTGHAITFEGGREEIFNTQGVDVWGKTGTATASPIVGDPDGEGPAPRQVLEAGDHSWFVVLVGRGRPQYAIAVVIDFGGSGGKVSGPIVNQIVRALVAEGYL